MPYDDDAANRIFATVLDGNTYAEIERLLAQAIAQKYAFTRGRTLLEVKTDFYGRLIALGIGTIRRELTGDTYRDAVRSMSPAMLERAARAVKARP